MIAITNGEIWTMTNGSIKNGTVLIEDGKTQGIGAGLEVGKDVDIAIFNGHPFDYKTLTEMVFVDGKLVYQRDTET